VKGFTREDVARFHAARWAPARALLLVVGDVDPAEATDLAREHFGAWKAKRPPVVEVPPAPPLPANRILVVHKAGATQAQIRFAGFGVPARTDPDYFPALVANGAFGGGFTSRLVDEIRVNRGLSYGARTRFSQLRGGGFFVFSSFTKNESIGELVAVALAEAERARREGFADAEIERARSYLTGLYPLRLETNEQISAAMAEMHLFGLPPDWVSAYRGRLAAVTAAMANETARRWFFAEPFSMVIVGDEASIRRGLEQAGVEGDVTVVPIEELE
jgi:zinc protease